MIRKWGLPQTSLRLSGNILLQNGKSLNSEIYLALRVLDKLLQTFISKISVFSQ